MPIQLDLYTQSFGVTVYGAATLPADVEAELSRLADDMRSVLVRHESRQRRVAEQHAVISALFGPSERPEVRP